MLDIPTSTFEIFLLALIIVVQEQAAVIAKLNAKLKSTEDNLEDANKHEILYLTLQPPMTPLFSYTILSLF